MSEAYHVFAGLTYYPSGGYSDYIGSFPTLEGARFQATRKETSLSGGEVPAYDWWHIVRSDSDSLALVKVEENS